MKNLNRKKLFSIQKEKGITLIALIVTIIIVIILASVSVAIFSNSNIIKKSKFAGENYQNKINQEEKAMQNYINQINGYEVSNVQRDNKIDFIYKIIPTSEIIEFNYTGNEQEFTAQKDGYYKIECWGAQGGAYGGYSGGKGAYTKGIIKLNKNDKLYVYVGECYDGYKNTMSFNGGGNGGNYSDRIESNGGGATDIRLLNGNWDNFEGLKSRIIVAAGGSGCHYFSDGRYRINGSPAGALNSFTGGYCGTGSPASYRSTRCYPNTRWNFCSLLQR